ncbi:hypothetical protein [Winogradskyella aurantiaca]|uniref:hypothetical protein n=1 Tax=Winogradskyella aurantiaca TaxID=2219558 RepID=UPI001E28794D|nr:hypothetical protein [Winogradskyella aurantiaca]
MNNLIKLLGISALSLTMCLLMQAQESQNELPFRELSEYPETFTANSVSARMIESLGFRFYWATESLEDNDFEFKLSEESRSIGDTMKHVYDLSLIIRNSAEKKTNKRGKDNTMNFQELRVATLNNLKAAVDLIGEADSMEEFKIMFGSNSFPFWNQVNGPIADAIWHCGQIATLRRASGNPMNSKVNHFSGTIRD